MKTKRFDCVDMMHQGAKRIHAATKGMSRKEELAYWQAKARELLPHATMPSHAISAVREKRATYRVSR